MNENNNVAEKEFEVLDCYTVNLYEGWNYISLAVDPMDGPYTAEILGSKIISTTGVNCYLVQMWDTIYQKWITHIVDAASIVDLSKVPEEIRTLITTIKQKYNPNFDIEVGYGYMLYMENPAAFEFVGHILHDALIPKLTSGYAWYSVGWYNDVSTTSEGITKILYHRGEWKEYPITVAKWDASSIVQKWDVYSSTKGDTVFEIRKGDGMMISFSEQLLPPPIPMM